MSGFCFGAVRVHGKPYYLKIAEQNRHRGFCAKGHIRPTAKNPAQPFFENKKAPLSGRFFVV